MAPGTGMPTAPSPVASTKPTWASPRNSLFRGFMKWPPCSRQRVQRVHDHPIRSVLLNLPLPLRSPPPPARLNMVTRPRLTQRMNTALRGTLTLIVAPAGWGKTTLLSAWHADASPGVLPLAWVSLDEGDNDPIRFWTYVISSLNTLHPGVGETALALMYASSSPPIED